MLSKLSAELKGMPKSPTSNKSSYFKERTSHTVGRLIKQRATSSGPQSMAQKTQKSGFSGKLGNDNRSRKTG
jgi:hypothetical protein